MRVYQIAKPHLPEKFLKKLGADPAGAKILSQKIELLYIKIDNLKAPAVNILKQDAISVGADLAVPKGAILCDQERYNTLLIGNLRELKALAKRELLQPFGLKEVARELERIIKGATTKREPKIMGVINANSDSFYSGSRFQGDRAIKMIEKMVEDGAKIIDIGAVSSRPASDAVPEDEELARVKDILEQIRERKLYEIVDFSIDSYSPKVVKEALDSGFKYINDIFGARDERLLKLAVKYRAKYIIMHMKGEPKSMQNNPTYQNVVVEVEDFFKKQIEKALNIGVKRDDIILDIGIGFGKTLQHNLELLRSLENFKKFNLELLVGASRKSMIDMIIPTPIEERLSGTLAIHLKALERGASIIRCHDVKEHKIAFEVYKEL